MKIAVVTNDVRKFNNFVKGKDDEHEYHCVTKVEDIRGRYFEDAIYLFAWYLMNDFLEIQRELPTRIIPNGVNSSPRLSATSDKS